MDTAKNITAGTAPATDLINAIDQLNHIGNLVEALHMAAGDVGDRQVTNALQSVAGTIITRVKELGDSLEELRSSSKAVA